MLLAVTLLVMAGDVAEPAPCPNAGEALIWVARTA
jgi:hypothetical protein